MTHAVKEREGGASEETAVVGPISLPDGAAHNP